MTHSRRPKTDTAEWKSLMEDAHVGEGPKPWCEDRPDLYSDYGYPLPSADEADDLCIDCPLMQACLRNAKHRAPSWGIWGGLVWVQGRQVHRMAADDERLLDPDRVIPELVG